MNGNSTQRTWGRGSCSRRDSSPTYLKALMEKPPSDEDGEATLNTLSANAIRKRFGLPLLSAMVADCRRCGKKIFTQTIGGRRVHWYCPQCHQHQGFSN